MRPRQRKFCLHYLQSLNASDAARKAGYPEKYSHVYGNRLLQKEAIKGYISERLNKAIDAETETIKSSVIRFWKEVAFSTCPEGENAYSFMQNKLKASELLAKYIGMLNSGSINIGEIDEVNIIMKVIPNTKEKVVSGECT